MKIYDGTKFAEAFSGMDKVTLFDLGAEDGAAEAAAMLASETFTTRDGTVLYYKDFGGPAVVFSHGHPLASDVGED